MSADVRRPPNLPSIWACLLAAVWTVLVMVSSSWEHPISTVIWLTFAQLVIAVNVRRTVFWYRNRDYLQAARAFHHAVRAMPPLFHLHTPDHGCFRSIGAVSGRGRRFVLFHLPAEEQFRADMSDPYSPVDVIQEVLSFQVGSPRVTRYLNRIRSWPDGSVEQFPLTPRGWWRWGREDRRGVNDLTPAELRALTDKIRSCSVMI